MFVWCALCITDIKGRSHECTVVMKQIPFSSNKISPYVMLAKSSLLFVHFCRYANRCSNSWTCVTCCTITSWNGLFELTSVGSVDRFLTF